MSNLFRLFLSVLVIGLISACGGGSTNTTPEVVIAAVTAPSPTSQCYVQTSGNAFISKSTSGTSTTGITSISMSNITYNTQPAQSRIENSTFTTSLISTAQAKSELISNLSTSGKYNRIASIVTPASGVSTVTTFRGNARSLKLGVGESETYTHTSTSGTSAERIFTSTLTLLAIEDLVTPAGTFKNSCKFAFETKPSGFVSTIFWYAPGWGNVKEISISNDTITIGSTTTILRSTTFSIEATNIVSGKI